MILPRRRAPMPRLLRSWWLALALSAFSAAALAAEPLKLGFGMALTGPLAGTGRAALLATEMWAADQNARGGLLGRPIELVYYDDQSNGATVPGLYSKLLDIDKVDLIVSGYATNMIAPLVPIAMQRGLVLMSLFGLAVNQQFHYDRYFQIVPSGDDPAHEFSQGYIELAASMAPPPRTIALVGADAEFGRIALEGARDNAEKRGLKVVYSQRYPPGSVDFAPVIRAIQAAEPDIVYVASYPGDTVGIIRAANEARLKARMFGGGMIGLQYAAVKQQLGPLLNGIVYWDVYVPSPTMNFPGLADFLAGYQTKASAAGADPLGFYTPPYAYARLQVLAQAIEAVKSLDQTAIAAYLHKTRFSTVVGDITFGESGEPSDPRALFVQYRGIAGNDLEQFKRPGTQVILYPPAYKSGDFAYPYGGQN
jgi:branched-chain amino acid transport system substrate-binding protein